MFFNSNQHTKQLTSWVWLFVWFSFCFGFLAVWSLEWVRTSRVQNESEHLHPGANWVKTCTSGRRKPCCINIWDRLKRREPLYWGVFLPLNQNSLKYQYLAWPNATYGCVARRLLNHPDLSKKALWDFPVSPEKGVQQVGQGSLIENKQVGGMNRCNASSSVVLL